MPGVVAFRLTRGLGHALALVCVLSSTALPGAAQPGREVSPPTLNEFGEEEEADLREQLTERQDETRRRDPLTVEVFGRPLTLSGQISLEVEAHRREILGAGADPGASVRPAVEVEAEAFYPLAEDVYVFAQALVGWERFVVAPSGLRQVESSFAERGEMWLNFRNLFGEKLHLEIGRLDFDDDRTFWWDEDLDAVRIEYDGDPVSVELAFAREIAPRSTLEDGVSPDSERVMRTIAEVSWDWSDAHAIDLLALHQSDRSKSHVVGEIVRDPRIDELDASLTWLGLRAAGFWGDVGRGHVVYWLDLARVRGRESAEAFEPVSKRRSVVVERTVRRIRGWAVDGGLTWHVRAPLDPRLTLAWAIGSGGSARDGRIDRSFRQTGLHANEAGFGGWERFPRYGIALAPELSNLRVVSFGVGISLLEKSSLDLMLHDYHMPDPGVGLRDARVDLELDGSRRHVGSAVDLVLAVEEWDAVAVHLGAGAFRGGRALASGVERWGYGGFLNVSFGF